MKKVFLFLLIVLLVQLSNSVYGAIPSSERTALIALYNSTNGDQWKDNTGWKTPPLNTDGFAMPGTEENWKGVTVSESHVTKLQLTWLYLKGSIPSELRNLSNLQILNLSNNQISGNIPPELGYLYSLKTLNLSDNQLSGSIPSQLGYLYNLQGLYLYLNQLSGTIPSELGNLYCLQILYLNNNQLTGSIPPKLGSLGSLYYLDLSYNQLNGSITTELTNLSNLYGLNLSNNKLTGSIPTELENIKFLQTLQLQFNQLSGNIPLSLKNLPSLYSIDISFNCLTASEIGLRNWLSLREPDWEAYQNECANGPSKPIVTTALVSSIGFTSAVGGGNIISDGGAEISEKGICYSAEPNPTISNLKSILYGNQKGYFSCNMGDLEPDRKYYLRAFAKNSKGFSYGANVSFITLSVLNVPKIALNRIELTFGAVANGDNPGQQTVRISNDGKGALNWTASTNVKWLSVTPTSGTENTNVSVSVNHTGIAVGDYFGVITIFDENASNSPRNINVYLHVYSPGKSTQPFGGFETPVDGSSGYNSIPVTGWALDDIGIANVKIYNNNSYIGDAVFVENARPDVEWQYSNYPNSYKAGWGYMLLTNFLPNGGNGSYTITARATDIEGHEMTLGSKTITIDNAHATKPFGAIDTPEQGGTASGKTFVNFGWALTPQPNTITSDGSTIDVIIDGVVQGHAGYNQLRSDIASLFPGYNNTNSAGGYFYIDTTKLKNGRHSISWNVTDNKGNSDGIGSRYFTVMNTGTGSDSAVSSVSTDSNILQSSTYMNEFNTETIEIKELERLEIHFADLPNAPTHHLSGYLVIQNQLRECPVGSTLDKDNGIFYWQPGPGFVGKYRFVFTGEDENGQNVQKNIIVNIKSRF